MEVLVQAGLEVDKKLYGGFNRGESTYLPSTAGGGKSLFLQNLALNWAFADKI